MKIFLAIAVAFILFFTGPEGWAAGIAILLFAFTGSNKSS